MKLAAQKRAAGKAPGLRREGRLPGIVYNKELNLPVSVDLRDFDKVFRNQGTSAIIDLEVDGERHEVLVKAVQMDKRRRLPQHVDFYAVTANQPVDVYVHLNYEGTPAGAREGGQVDVQRRELHIRVIPRLIPQHGIEVDVSHLGIGESVHVADIVGLLPTEAEVLDDEGLTLITILPPRLVDEAADTAGEAGAEPEVIRRGGEDDEDEGDSEE